MTKIVKSPKKQSAKITKLKMRVGEIANMLLQNNPKMVRMRSGGSSGYADLFMSKQLMKGGMNDKTQTAIVDFLNKDETKKAVKALKEKVIKDDNADPKIKDELYKELYNYKLCDKYNDVDEEDLKDDLITLDIVNKFYLLLKDKKIANVYVLKDDDFENYKISVPANVVNSLRQIADNIPLPDDNDDDTPIVLSKELKVANAIKERDRLIEERDRLIKEQKLDNENNLEITDESKQKLTDVLKNLEEAEAELAELQKTAAPSGGKPPAKYKSTGRIVCIMYKKRKYKRTVYVKDKRNTKYCKIDGEYILLSKMKMIA